MWIGFLDDRIGIVNFYCVENKASKESEVKVLSITALCVTGKHHYYVEKGCSRCWMNENDGPNGKNYGSSGINFCGLFYQTAIIKMRCRRQKKAKPLITFLNIHIFTKTWSRSHVVGDIERILSRKLKIQVEWKKVDILFAPHHGRDSGKVPDDILKQLNPGVIVVGAAPSEHLNYYQGYNTITQNSAQNIIFRMYSRKSTCIFDKSELYYRF